MKPETFRRTIALVAALLTLAMLASACGDDTTTETGSGDETAETTASPPDEPDDATGETGTMISHKFGDVVVPADPQRVVTVGFSDQDDLLALGVIPVGIRDWYGDQPDAVWPWARAALGSGEPEVLPADELNIEMVAALEPDLIIGVSSGMTEGDYQLLSAIAPTVAQLAEYPDYGMPWQERSRLIGAAVGKAAEAEELIAGIEARFADARAEHPEFDGRSAAVAFVHEDQPGAYASADVRARLMADLGFVTPPEYDEIAGASFFASFSAERIDLLDTDVIVWLTSDPTAVEAIVGSPLRSGLTAVAEGREIYVSSVLGGAFSFASPLSLGFMLDELVPELGLAVDGDPATAVPSAVAAGAAPEATASDDGESAVDADRGGDGDGAGATWELVFDTSVPWAEKADHIEGAADLEASHEAYVTTGDAVGGIGVEVTAETIDGTSAEVVYSILFAGNPTYADLEGVIEQHDDGWLVSREEFCGFLASARTPCES